ncbi:hypothetical protein SUGI_0145230, partial [Cryptomeria japonica]
GRESVYIDGLPNDFSVTGNCNGSFQENITVGGNNGWHYGYNYSDWITKVGQVYVGDWLVFKYPAPTSNSMAHSVVQIQNKARFKKCNVGAAIKLAGPTQGTGNGFHFRLKRVRHYFFACGLGNTRHCTVGQMRFGILPVVKTG